MSNWIKCRNNKAIMLVHINESVLFCLITVNEWPVGRQNVCRTSAPPPCLRMCVCGYSQPAMVPGALKRMLMYEYETGFFFGCYIFFHSQWAERCYSWPLVSEEPYIHFSAGSFSGLFSFVLLSCLAPSTVLRSRPLFFSVKLAFNVILLLPEGWWVMCVCVCPFCNAISKSNSTLIHTYISTLFRIH